VLRAERCGLPVHCRAYAIDEETAIRIVDGAVDVISEENCQGPSARLETWPCRHAARPSLAEVSIRASSELKTS
jgi:hypothetical protein